MLPGNNLHEIFAARVREAPHRVAVVSGDSKLTYGQLDARANQVAHRLRALGAGTDTLVALCCERGIPLIVGMLGILKAGGAYVPVDPAYPDERIDLLLAGGGITLAVAAGPVADRLSATGAKVVRLDDRTEQAPPMLAGDLPPVSGADLAYVIHTSGSTGAPKGVLVEHRNVVRLFTSTSLWFGFDHRDVWTMCHSPSFDFSVWEIWGALLYGGRLVVVPVDATRQPLRLLELLRREQVTVLSQTPSAFRALVGSAEPADGLDLHVVVLGGERLDVAMLRPWLDRFGDSHPRLVNMYGITETTVHVTYRQIRRTDLAEPEHSPIGVAIPDLRLSLHDGSGQQVADGTPGEIWVSGAGVARGYLNQDELTRQRFVSGPDGVRGYRSGDLAVRSPRGDLRYLGRVDDQLQVRGYRIEPYEVESSLCGHPSVAAAVVTAREYPDGDVRLVAYVQPSADHRQNGGDPLAGELSDHVAARLPAHLRPSHYVVVERLPMTPQGKVDRAALRNGDRPPEPVPAGVGRVTAAAAGGRVTAAGGRVTAAGGRVTAAGGRVTAAAVGSIAAAVLERDRVPLDEDLFDLGATSLMFARIVAEVNERFQVSLTGSEVEVASAAALAAVAAGPSILSPAS